MSVGSNNNPLRVIPVSALINRAYIDDQQHTSPIELFDKDFVRLSTSEQQRLDTRGGASCLSPLITNYDKNWALLGSAAFIQLRRSLFEHWSGPASIPRSRAGKSDAGTTSVGLLPRHVERPASFFGISLAMWASMSNGSTASPISGVRRFMEFLEQ